MGVGIVLAETLDGDNANPIEQAMKIKISIIFKKLFIIYSFV
jgi:hypothetical protein